MQSKYCEDCRNVFYDHFCGYAARCCLIHGTIDCNPDSYIDNLEGDCPDFITPEEYKIKKQKEYEEKNLIDSNIDKESINKLIEALMKEYFTYAV